MKRAFATFVASAILAAGAQAGDILASAGTSLLPDQPESKATFYGDGAMALSQEKYKDLPAIRYDVNTASDKPWNVASNIKADKGISKGDVILMAFCARSCDSETTDFRVIFQLNKDPYTGIAYAPVKVGPEWQFVVVTAMAKEDIPAENLTLTLQLGAKKQSVEVAGLTVLDFGKIDEAFLASCRTPSAPKEPEKPETKKTGKTGSTTTSKTTGGKTTKSK